MRRTGAGGFGRSIAERAGIRSALELGFAGVEARPGAAVDYQQGSADAGVPRHRASRRTRGKHRLEERRCDR